MRSRWPFERFASLEGVSKERRLCLKRMHVFVKERKTRHGWTVKVREKKWRGSKEGEVKEEEEKEDKERKGVSGRMCLR